MNRQPDKLRWAFEDLRGRIEADEGDAETLLRVMKLIDEVEEEWSQPPR